MKLSALVVLGACGTSPVPNPLAHAPAISCDEEKLRTLAGRLGDPAPEVRVVMVARGRKVKHDCPSEVDDARCIELARRSATLGAGESIRGVEIADGRSPGDEPSHWVVTLLVDGQPVVEHFPDEAAVTERMRDLRAKGHKVVSQSGERVSAPDRRVPDRRVASVTIDAPSAHRRVAIVRTRGTDVASIARVQDDVAAARMVVNRFQQLRDGTGVELEVGCD